MIKKIIAVSSIILVLLILIIISVSKLKNKLPNERKNTFLTPTSFILPKSRVGEKKDDRASSQPSAQPTVVNRQSEKTSQEKFFYNGALFQIKYRPEKDEYIVYKRPFDKDFNKKNVYQWAKENNIPQNKLVITNQENKDDGNLGVDIFKILSNFGKGSQIIIDESTKNNSDNPNVVNSSNNKGPSGKYTYYPQCNGSFDSYLLPDGCNLCKAGCGPTNVSMIIASYVDKSVKPPDIVDYYKKRGYYLGCGGSGYQDAKSTLESYGLKTTDYINFRADEVSYVAKELRNYLKSGWTIFALANFCDAGCGHYLWITKVDDNNNIWAYDSYYGRFQSPPLNENKYNPFPRYRIAFGVKKK